MSGACILLDSFPEREVRHVSLEEQKKKKEDPYDDFIHLSDHCKGSY